MGASQRTPSQNGIAETGTTAYSWPHMSVSPSRTNFTPVVVHTHRRPTSPLAPDAAALERFLGYCHRRRYPPRTDVFRPGDPAGPERARAR